MSDTQLVLSPKMKKFFKFKDCDVEVLEGQTAAGKTTVGAIKFILLCNHSKRSQHFIAGLDIGTIEKNIISEAKDLSILDFFEENEVKYNGNGTSKEKLPHILLNPGKPNEKIIYVFGYFDSSKWKKALGGQVGCGLIDEVNIADMEFVREAMHRCQYIMMTLNPDDPNLPIYSEFINHARPLKEYECDVPNEMMSQLLSQPSKPKWIHWFFRMDDNAALSEEEKEKKRNALDPNSKMYKNKILGLRGRSEGLVFQKFERGRNTIPLKDFRWLPMEQVYRIIVGLDSGLNADATAAVPMMLTTAGRVLAMPTMYYIPKLGTNASSQQATIVEKWLDYWSNYFGVYNPSIVAIVGDSAALTQTLLLEINMRTHYKASKVGEKNIMADTQRAIGFIDAENYFYIIDAGFIDPVTYEQVGNTDMFIIELENKVWDKKKGNVPEDGNDHAIDAFKYGTYYIYNGGM